MRSGRYYKIASSTPDYYDLLNFYGPSRHFTMVFNTFVVLQIFNFFNCRKIQDELNILEGIFLYNVLLHNINIRSIQKQIVHRNHYIDYSLPSIKFTPFK